MESFMLRSSFWRKVAYEPGRTPTPEFLSRRVHAVRGGVNQVLWAEQFWNGHLRKLDREIFEDCPSAKIGPLENFPLYGTILQLSPHTFKVVQILQYYIVWTDRLQATSSPAPWWNPVAVACLKYRVIRNHMWLILYYFLVSCDVHARISYVKHHIPCKQCFTFYHNRAGKCYTKATNNHHIQMTRLHQE